MCPVGDSIISSYKVMQVRVWAEMGGSETGETRLRRGELVLRSEPSGEPVLEKGEGVGLVKKRKRGCHTQSQSHGKIECQFFSRGGGVRAI